MTVIQDYIKEIINSTIALKNEILSIEGDCSVICFRGENKDYDETKLVPSLFRHTTDYPLDKDLLDLLSDYEVSSNTASSSLAKAIDGQHYISVSRLLDISFSLLPALYFATTNNEEEANIIINDAYVYVFSFPETFSPNSDYIKNYYESIVNDKFSPFSKDFKVISHSYNNQRIIAQNGGFILFSGRTPSKIPKEYYQTITIKKEDILQIRQELEDYFCISESTIFPEKDKRKNVILNKLKNSHRMKNSTDLFTTEIDYYLSRIEFETKIKKNKEESITDIKRFIRKERSYLKSYLKDNKKHLPEDKSVQIEKEIELRLTLIKREVES